MNKVFTSLLIAAALILTTTSCVAQKSNDNRVSWTVPVTSFTEITENSSIDIRVTAKAAKDVTCYTSGSGDISANVNASGSVTATTTGSGDIHLSGSARSIRERSTGSGDIHSKGLKTGN